LSSFIENIGIPIMTITMKVRRIGNSLGLIMPRELAEHMHAKEGDTVHVVTERGGAVRIAPYDPNFEKAMKAFEETRRNFRNAFRTLAKK
jgi:putative addiction module antidote